MAGALRGREELGSKAPPQPTLRLGGGRGGISPSNPRRRSEELGTVLAEREGSGCMDGVRYVGISRQPADELMSQTPKSRIAIHSQDGPE